MTILKAGQEPSVACKRGGISIRSLLKTYGAFHAVNNVNLDIEPGSFVSILGPSGCGKTTTLRMIAGFVKPDGGVISTDGDVVSDSHSVKPPNKREMGMVFQGYAVWPHMTVYKNVIYGLAGRPASEIAEKAKKTFALVGLEGQEAKYPSQLSGGQQQRVALARAIITEPRILLLDEPLSNLDAKLRETMRFELRRLQKALGITAVFVTHSQEEALLLSDKIAVMRAGELIEFDEPRTLYERPRTKFVAEFIGLANFLEGQVVEVDASGCAVETPFGRVLCRSAEPPSVGSAATVLVRPEQIHLGADHKRETAGNRLVGTISEIAFSGAIVDYIVRLESGSRATYLRVQRFGSASFAVGEIVSLSFSQDAARLVTP